MTGGSHPRLTILLTTAAALVAVATMLAWASPTWAQAAFASKTDFGAGTAPESVAAADLDADGDQDLATVNASPGASSGSVSVLLNVGDGSFAAKTDFGVGRIPATVVAADLDADGDQDLAATNQGSGSVSVLYNDGAGSFPKGASFAVGTSPAGLATADLDGDGDQDLTTANVNSGSVSVLYNDGAGSFEQASFGAGFVPFDVAATDLDGDGDVDLAVANRGSDDLSVLVNDGTGSFTLKANYGAADGPFSIVAADLDGDGDPDLATANQFSSNVSVFPNAGDGSFGTRTDLGLGTAPRRVEAADLDGDGDVDLATANWNASSISVLPNDGSGSFAGGNSFGTGANPYAVEAADLDGDGDPDLATANRNPNNVSVLINVTPQADLAVGASDSADPALAGGDLTYTFAVTNRGPATATKTVLTDKLPAGLGFVSASASRGSCAESGGTVSCALGDLPRGTAATVEIVVRPEASAAPSVSNTATVRSDRTDFQRADNSATETTAVNRAPVVQDDAVATDLGVAIEVDVLANDTDPDGDALSLVRSSQPDHGRVACEPSGLCAYTPGAGYAGADRFTYSVTDNRGSSDFATVRVSVRENTKPTVGAVSPSGKRVSRTANVTATFSEAMDASTLNRDTFYLTRRGAKVSTATVTYSSSTQRATLDPDQSLVRGATYTATVTTGAKDLSGNPLAQARVWSFTVKR